MDDRMDNPADDPADDPLNDRLDDRLDDRTDDLEDGRTGDPTLEAPTRVLDRVGSVVLGQDEILRQILITILAGGHALLEGVPGTGKTLAVRALGMALDLRFGRVQFTPDLMPTDLVGVNVFDRAGAGFEYHPGPVFTDLLLADEINRAPAKTQSALLEAMEERQVTIDGESRRLPDAFTVLATQNPLEFEGTYPLPEAQLDRFLLKISVEYPERDAERRILDRYADGFQASRSESFGIEPVVDGDGLRRLRRVVREVHVEPSVRDYITRIVRATREHPSFTLGASPRAGVGLFLAARARAVLEGRDFSVPDDVKSIAPAVLRHRVILTPEMEVEGRGVDLHLDHLLDSVEAPGERVG